MKNPVIWFVGFVVLSLAFGWAFGPDSWEIYIMLALGLILAKQVEIVKKIQK